jgi:hypothetical protein
MSFHQPREVPSESYIKYKTKDNFFTPKVQNNDGDSIQQIKTRNKSTHKIEKPVKREKRENDETVRPLKEKVAKLTRQRDELMA